MNGKELRSFIVFKYRPNSHTPTLAEMFKLTDLKLVYIHCKTVKVSPNDQFQS